MAHPESEGEQEQREAAWSDYWRQSARNEQFIQENPPRSRLLVSRQPVRP